MAIDMVPQGLTGFCTSCSTKWLSTMSSFTSSQAEVLGLFTVNIFWGIHIVSFGYSTSALLFTPAGLKPRRELNQSLFALTVILATIGTCTIVLNGIRAVDSLAPGSITAQFNNLHSRVSLLRFALVNIQFVLADAMMVSNHLSSGPWPLKIWRINKEYQVYQCRVIWKHPKSWAFSLPVFLWLAIVSTMVWDLYDLATMRSDNSVLQLRDSATSFWAISLALKVLISSASPDDQRKYQNSRIHWSRFHYMAHEQAL